MRSAVLPSPASTASSALPHTSPSTPAKVVAAFNTWAFKREQPCDLALLTRTVGRAVAAGGPVPFVLYWGKGPRNGLARPDEDCLDYLAGMADRIAAVHAPGAAIELLLTDTHARLNRHADSAIAAYHGAVAEAAARRGFTSRRLSDVVAAMPPCATAATGAPAADPDVLDLLTKSASKWYAGDGSPRLGAIEYYAMNMVEKRAVEAAYPYAVFVTFNNSDFRVLFPDGMPIFYMYSLRKGFAVKPWFIGEAS